MASPASPTPDKVQHLQQTRYRAAKADPRRRFHAQYDKVPRPDVLHRAWDQVRSNRGAAGVDRVTVTAVAAYGESRLVEELAAELRAPTYRPLPARRVWMPKPGSTEQRPLATPAVRDRIVQAALKLVIEPVFEADFRPVSFGCRPKTAAHDALHVLLDEAVRGPRWVMATDMAHCLDAIPHDRRMTAGAARLCDRHVVRLGRGFLQAGVMAGTAVRHRATGPPQGGVISPLLANIYLHALDQAWERDGQGRLVRYAEDLVVLCGPEQEAAQACGRGRPFGRDGHWSQRRRKHAWSTSPWVETAWTFWASTTAGSGPAAAPAASGGNSSPAGPRVGRGSRPGIASGALPNADAS